MHNICCRQEQKQTRPVIGNSFTLGSMPWPHAPPSSCVLPRLAILMLPTAAYSCGAAVKLRPDAAAAGGLSPVWLMPLLKAA